MEIEKERGKEDEKEKKRETSSNVASTGISLKKSLHGESVRGIAGRLHVVEDAEHLLVHVGAEGEDGEERVEGRLGRVEVEGSNLGRNNQPIGRGETRGMRKRTSSSKFRAFSASPV